MPPYTGDYIEHIEPGKNSLKFYSFTPRPLMRGHMYQMDDELAALLIDAHRNIGFLEGLIKYAPNKEAFAELMLLKECTYSRMIDYDSPDFKEVLTSRGTGRGNISPIIDLEAASRRNIPTCSPCTTPSTTRETEATSVVWKNRRSTLQENAVVPLWTTNSPTAGQSLGTRSLWIIFTTRKYAALRTPESELKKYDLRVL